MTQQEFLALLKKVKDELENTAELCSKVMVAQSVKIPEVPEAFALLAMGYGEDLTNLHITLQKFNDRTGQFSELANALNTVARTNRASRLSGIAHQAMEP